MPVKTGDPAHPDAPMLYKKTQVNRNKNYNFSV
jgi:hypothetical protein